MKVNLHMLQEDLERYELKGRIADDPWTLRCTHAKPLTQKHPASSLREDLIYLVTADALPDDPPSDRTLTIICIGAPPAAWMRGSCNILYTEKDISLLELFSAVSDAMAVYTDWGDGLQELIDRGASFQEMADFSHCVVANPIYLQGTEFLVLAHSIPQDAEDTPLLQTYKELYRYAGLIGSTLPEDDIVFLISDEEYRRSADQTAPAIYSGNYTHIRSLYYNIKQDGVFVGRMTFDEVIAPLTDRDYALITILSDYLGKVFAQKGTYDYDRFPDTNEVLQGLLAHRLLPEQRINNVVRGHHWSMNDRFVCLVVNLLRRNETATALLPLAAHISQVISSQCYTVFAQSIVFVCNLTKLSTDSDELVSRVLPTLRDNFLILSVSSDYTDFKDLYYYYRQASECYHVGSQKHPTRWVFRCEEYRLDVMVDKLMRKNIADAMIPHGLRVLMEHDQEKGSDYVHLLRLYLDNDRNTAKTARNAFIHRNTCIYKLGHIQELMQVDLDDPDVRLVLQMAFRIIDEARARGTTFGLIREEDAQPTT
jgi:hypothetical protein